MSNIPASLNPQVSAPQATENPQNEPPAKTCCHSANWAYIVALLITLSLIALGITLAVLNQHWTVLAVGAGCLVAVTITWPLAASLAAARAEDRLRQEELTTTITERLQGISLLLNMVSEQQLLSDRAKAVAFREKDRDALRRAIREDLGRSDWEAAAALVDDMERVFGYKAEADRFREEIDNHRQETQRKQVLEVSARVDAHCRAERWNDAIREAERLIGALPGNEHAAQLPVEIENRRQAHKRQLQDSLREAVARNDNEGSLEILKKLDLYLTRAEAEAMEETARNIFKERLNILRTQFSLAVHDNKPEQLRIAEAIIRDFPNSGIARELRDQMDNIRKRVADQQHVEVARV